MIPGQKRNAQSYKGTFATVHGDYTVYNIKSFSLTWGSRGERGISKVILNIQLEME